MTDLPLHRPLLRSRSRSVALAAALAVIAPAALAVVGPATTASARPTPVRTTDVEVHPRSAAPRDLGGQLPADAKAGAITDVHRVAGGLAVVGATWAQGAVLDGDRLEVRTRRNGVWQPWQEMEVDDAGHGPDADAPEARASRPGTAPVVVEGDASQVRVVTSRPAAPTVDVSFVDPGSSDSDLSVGATAAGSAAAAAVRPAIHTRKEWGADESLRKGTPLYGQVHVGFVHHTVGTNSYSAAQVPAIIRGIYAFHVNGRGWNDIGYQFLVDRFGRIWEGRAGGVDKAVIGAQAGGYNSGSMGVSVIGDFTSTSPPAVVTNALVSVLSWRFGLSGIPATGTAVVNDKTFNRISGHRDANSTACPGARLYATLPALRQAVASRLGTLPRTAVNRDVDRNGSPDLVSLESLSSGAKVARLHLSAPRNPLHDPVAVGGGWNTVRYASLSPDLTGDRRPDVVAVHAATGALRVYPGTGAGRLGTPRSSGSGWNRMAAVIPAGDQNRDGRNDLFGIGGTGALAFYAGRADGTVAAGVVVGRGYQNYRSVTASADRTGDGTPDGVAVRASDGALVVMAARGNGALGAPVAVAGGWDVLSPVISAGDLDGDGAPDLLGREAGGAMRTYYGGASVVPARWNRWGSAWGSMSQTSSGQDLDGDGVVDVLSVLTTSDNGTLRLYPGTGARDEARTVDVPLPDAATMVGIAGDIDADGNVDLVARVGDAILAYPGIGGGHVGPARTVASSGWSVMPVVVPGADVSYDGIPDLLATSSTGLILRYGFRRDFTLERPLELEQGWGSLRAFSAVGAMNVDANGDVATLDDTGAIRLFRGGGNTPLLDSTVLTSGQAGLVAIVGAGDWNGDGQPDVVARDADGHLWLYAGRGGGLLWGGRQPLATSTTTTIG